MKEALYEVRCLKSTEDMILALAGQFKQLSHEPEKFTVYIYIYIYIYIYLYNNKINARVLIGQSAMVYCAGKPMEKSRVF